MKKRPSLVREPHRASVTVLLLFMAFTTSSAGQPGAGIVLDRMSATVGELMSEIRRQANVTFVFDSRTLDISRVVMVEKNTYGLADAVELITAGMDYSYMIKEDYVVINSSAELQNKGQQLQKDPRYVPTKPEVAGAIWSERPVQPETDTVSGPEPVTRKIYAEPYSAYIEPALYLQPSKKVPLLAVKTNILYGAAAISPNLSGEIGVTSKTTVEAGGSWNRFKRTGTADSNKKLNHWVLRTEFRRWMCGRFEGHFLGVHAFYSQYNISRYNVPLLFDKKYRYEGNAYGVGITYGYHLPLAKRWGAEFHAGAGVARLKYDRFDCILCSEVIESRGKTYVGPTRAGVSIVFLIK